MLKYLEEYMSSKTTTKIYMALNPFLLITLPTTALTQAEAVELANAKIALVNLISQGYSFETCSALLNMMNPGWKLTKEAFELVSDIAATTTHTLSTVAAPVARASIEAINKDYTFIYTMIIVGACLVLGALIIHKVYTTKTAAIVNQEGVEASNTTTLHELYEQEKEATKGLSYSCYEESISETYYSTFNNVQVYNYLILSIVINITLVIILISRYYNRDIIIKFFTKYW